MLYDSGLHQSLILLTNLTALLYAKRSLSSPATSTVKYSGKQNVTNHAWTIKTAITAHNDVVLYHGMCHGHDGPILLEFHPLTVTLRPEQNGRHFADDILQWRHNERDADSNLRREWNPGGIVLTQLGLRVFWSWWFLSTEFSNNTKPQPEPMLPYRADSRLAPSQWETSLQSNAISHRLGANLESAPRYIVHENLGTPECNMDGYISLTSWPLGDFNLILSNFQTLVNFQILVNGGWGISYKSAFRWMPLDLTDDKPTLVQVMGWCRQTTSHYLSQCWPRSMPPNGVTRPQWVNSLWPSDAIWRHRLGRRWFS